MKNVHECRDVDATIRRSDQPMKLLVGADFGITAETLGPVVLLRGLSIPAIEPPKLGPSQWVVQCLSTASGKPGQEGGTIVFTSTFWQVLRHLVCDYQISVASKLLSIRATFLPSLFVSYRSADFEGRCALSVWIYCPGSNVDLHIDEEAGVGDPVPILGNQHDFGQRSRRYLTEIEDLCFDSLRQFRELRSENGS